jgi:hypothetical protein
MNFDLKPDFERQCPPILTAEQHKIRELREDLAYCQLEYEKITHEKRILYFAIIFLLVIQYFSSHIGRFLPYASSDEIEYKSDFPR